MNTLSTQPEPFIRPPAVAGLFYPGEPVSLKETVAGLLAELLTESGKNAKGAPSAVAKATPARTPKAIIAPHAGFIYSGPIAASAYGKLESMGTQIRRVVLLGPTHRVGFRGLAATGADFFRTPLGDVPIDRDAIASLMDLPQVVLLDRAHAEEHSLEVHLPFLQGVLGDFMLAPLVVGDAHPQDVAQVLEKVWGGSDTLIVISSDLSHYLPYGEARQRDKATARAIEALDGPAIHAHDACGLHPIRGLLHLAKQRSMAVARLDLRNSGDTAGDRRRVVGYGAWAFFEPGETRE